MEEPSPIILPLLFLFFFFAGTRSPSSNQSYFPSRKILNLHPEGVSLLWPLLSLLSHLDLYICLASNLREVPTRRCSGFLVIPGLKEIANMER
jgi:hypothetical protein